MSITLTFYTFGEKKPNHNQKILWLQRKSDFDIICFEPKEVIVEYQFEEIDKDGNSTGISYLYEDCIGVVDSNIKPIILLNGYKSSEYDLWMDLEIYWSSLSLI